MGVSVSLVKAAAAFQTWELSCSLHVSHQEKYSNEEFMTTGFRRNKGWLACADQK